MTRTTAILAALALLAAPVAARHHPTPPIVRLTTAGDAFLPRVPPFGYRLAVALGGQILRLEKDGFTFTALTTQGNNANPTVSGSGNVVAWDSDGNLLGGGDPGRQIYLLERQVLSQATHDPTGTSTNPALSGRGTRLAFESTGDLASTGNPGALQVFLRTEDGTLRQVSQGVGTSRNAVLSRRGRDLAFESTSDPATGADTGVAQMWLLTDDGVPAPITAGAGPSRLPSLTSRARFVAFDSTADLTGTGADTGVTQVFVYHVKSRNLAQVTNDPAGCSGASLRDAGSDTRVGFVCSGEGFFHLLRVDSRFRLPITGGDTAQALAAHGNHFMLVSTTADLLAGGTTAGHQLYLLNLFKLAPEPVAGTITWFPDAGFRP